MRQRQFRVLYREFLFRMVDIEALSAHAQRDANRLLGRFISLLIAASLLFSIPAIGLVSGGTPNLNKLMFSWFMQHFMISTTMLVVGIFAVLSWESTFPDRRDVLVLAPLPVSGSTLFFAKAAAVASALALIVAALHSLCGLISPLGFSQRGADAAPALAYLSPMRPLSPEDLGPVLDRDLAPFLRSPYMAQGSGGAMAIGVIYRGSQRVFHYGVAKPDSVFEIGSLSKPFTGLLLPKMVADERASTQEPVRDLLPAGTARQSGGREITLTDLAIHCSGLPRMPDGFEPADPLNPLVGYGPKELYQYVSRHGLTREPRPGFQYSDLGYALLGQALADRAHTPFPELLQSEIAGPLGLTDTSVALNLSQSDRLLPGHNAVHRQVPAWDTQVFAASGGIRSTAPDMMRFLSAQLHREATPALAAAIRDSHRLRTRIEGSMHMALGWEFNRDTGVYWASGGTGGFSGYLYFEPARDSGVLVLLNTTPTSAGYYSLIAEHLRQRLLGQPAISLDVVAVPAAGGGLLQVARSFAAYWMTMFAAGAFMYCCVLGLQGAAAQLLPRRWFLRVSSFLQLATFFVLVGGYFLLPSPQYALVGGSSQPLLALVPSYWFVGLFQQWNGTLHPSLAPFALRAWTGLAIALLAAGIAYALSYLRTMRQVLEAPDIVPVLRGASRLPRFGDSLVTAIVQFSIRTLLRSRQHRVVLAFYLGLGFAINILLLKTTLVRQLTGNSYDPWHEVSIPLLAASIIMMSAAVAGVRALFSVPLDLRSNWIFRVTPVRGAKDLLNARRRALFVLAVAPVTILFAAVLLALWPLGAAAGHVAALALTGMILVEFCLGGPNKIPFTCSYLPGKSNLHITFWLCIGFFFAVVAKGADLERQALEHSWTTVALVLSLTVLWLTARWRSSSLAGSEGADATFEDAPADAILTLDLRK